MAVKSILVHLNDRRRAARLLTMAKALAAPAGASITGLHVYSGLPPVAPVVVPYGDDVIAAIEQAEARESDAIKAVFDEQLSGQGDRAIWACERSAGPDLAEHVMGYARGADLVIAAAADPDWEMAPVLDFPERLALETGRPVVLVPNTGTFDRPPAHAVIAWNGSRESARAGFDAAALLEKTVRTTVLVIDDGEGERHRASAGRFAETMTRHGRTATVAARALSGRPIGEAIAAEALALGADLLVMGAYGHSRFREFVFGGATRHLTHRMSLPTLFSH